MRIFLLLLLLLTPSSRGAPQEADTILLNGNVYTANDAAPRAAAIAIKGERILFAGANDEARKFSGPATRAIDLNGKTVLPGLTDSHYHLLGVGERLSHLNLESATSRELFFAQIKEQVARRRGPLDHRSGLDRNLLEAARFSHPRRSG